MGDITNPDESRVLVIYTGGTIGMLVSAQGYAPEPGYLTDTLLNQTSSRFHDPSQDSLFSKSSSVEGYREYRANSGRSTPVRNSLAMPTHRVRSSRPIGQVVASPKKYASNQRPCCVKIDKDINGLAVYESVLPTLVTPSSVDGNAGRKRIRYSILEWSPLLDSSNCEIDDWIRIATEIELNYSNFDAFVVLHGTDTMAYTSSALSFLLQDLGKSVIITGAQIPLSQLRNDAVENLIGALSIAGHYIIPECCLYFNHTLFRGNRVSKISSYDLEAFGSPNFPPLVKVGIDIVINWHDVIRQTSLSRFRAHKEMSPDVTTLRLFPGISAKNVDAFITPSVRGVILETFGGGNAPQRADLMDVLKNACDRGVVVVAISQCSKGSVSSAYETGRTLLLAGVVSGLDMTPECALTKLAYLLSKPELSVAQIRASMGVPLRGELTRPRGAVPSVTFDQNLESMRHILSQFVRLSRSPETSTEDIVVPMEEVVAPWTWTAAEVGATESTLSGFLIHLAAAKDDIIGINACLSTASEATTTSTIPHTKRSHTTVGGLINCLEAGSGRSPLHTAALNGSVNCVGVLLYSGALVHLRDNIGHTPLYYAARQGHAAIVDLLRKSGADFGDFEKGHVDLAVKQATECNDYTALKIWESAGAQTADANQPSGTE